MSMNELKYFKKVDITEYIRQGLISGTFSVNEVFKTASVHARQGAVGETIVTILPNGTEEKRDTVKLDETTGNPGWVVTNPSGEQYIISDSIFNKKYYRDSDDPTKYIPRPIPVLSTVVNENIEFLTRGKPFKLEAGGTLIITSPTRVHGVEKNIFAETYSYTKKNNKASLAEAIALFEITKEELEAYKNSITNSDIITSKNKTTKSLDDNL